MNNDKNYLDISDPQQIDLISKFRVYLFAIVSVGLVGLVVFFQTKLPEDIIKNHGILVVSSYSVDSIVEVEDSIVFPVVYTVVPDMKSIHYKERMKKFVDLMLPSVLLAKEKMNLKRKRILNVRAAMDYGRATKKDSLFLEEVKAFYKTDDLEDVIKRLHPHPTSIILAQAAIESGWATSRFCKKANNVFGIWSYNSKEKRIKASEGRDGKEIYLRKYDTLFESVYDYLETISRANAYKEFRVMRLYSKNPYRLIWYLSNYSELRYEYVRSLRNVIEYRNLHKYDEMELAEVDENDVVWRELMYL